MPTPPMEEAPQLSKTEELRKLINELLLDQGERKDGQLEAVGYARVSKDHYRRSLSVDRQIRLIFEEAKRRGWHIRQVFFDNDRSASVYATQVREEFDQMVEHLKEWGADVLAYWEASRTSRDLEVYVPMRKLSRQLGLKWHYNGNTYDFTNYDDQFRTALDVVLSEREVEQMRARIKGGMDRAAKMGLPHGGYCPFGYTRSHDASGLIGQDLDESPRVTLVTAHLPVDEQVAYTRVEIVKEIFDRLASGDSCWNIARDLNVRGISTALGGRWESRSIGTIARNQAYLGWRMHNNERAGRGMWPAIIEDETTFDTVQVRLGDPVRRKAKSNKARYLLSSIAVCGECGGRLSVRLRKGRLDGTGYRTYFCQGQGDGTKPYGCVGIRCEKLDAYIETLLIARMSEPSTLEWLMRPDDNSSAQAAEEAAALRAKLDAWKVRAATGEIDQDDFLEISAGLKKKISDLEVKAVPDWVPPVVWELANGQAQQVWDNLTLAARRDVIRRVLSIRLKRVGPGRRPFNPSRVEVKWLLDRGRASQQNHRSRSGA